MEFPRLIVKKEHCFGPGELEARLLLALLGGLLSASWFSRLHSGGYDNVLLPAYLGISLLSGLGIALADRDKCFWRWTMPAAACLQLVLLAYLPAGHIPGEQDRLAGDRIVEQLREAEGEAPGPILLHTDLAVTDARLEVLHDSLWSFLGIEPEPMPLRWSVRGS